MQKTILLWVGCAICWTAGSCTPEKKSEEEPKTASPDAGPPSPLKHPWSDQTPTLVGEHQGTALHVAFSPDGRLLVSTGKDQLVKIWNVSTGILVHALKGHTGNVMMADFSSDGKLVLSASLDETARVWEVETGKLMKVLKDQPPKKLTEEEELASAQLPPPLMNWAVFSPDRKKIITASDDFALKQWDLATGKKLKVFRDDGCRQRRVHRRTDAPGWVSSAGCVGDGVAYLKFWDEDGNLVSVQGDENHDAHFLAFDQAGRFIIAADGSVSFSVFSSQGSYLKRILVGTYHFSIAFGPQDQTLLVGTDGGEVYVYQPGTWKLIGKLDVGERSSIECLAVGPTDGSLAVALRNGKVLRFTTPIL